MRLILIERDKARNVRLDELIERGPPHLRPLMKVVRDADVSLYIVAQSCQPFSIAEDRPAILLMGDDLSTAEGPSVFHAPSLNRFVARCRDAVIVASEPVPIVYASAAALAAAGKNVIIIETRPEREAEWKDALDAANPTLRYIIATVEPAEGIH